MEGWWNLIEKWHLIDEGGPRGKTPRRRKDSVSEQLEEVGEDWEQAYDGKRLKEIVIVTNSLNGS